MNTLSSLLNWIGNTIGANPNTLTTTSKKIVGAINEVDTKITNALDRQEITVTAASTSVGTFLRAECVRCGNVVTIAVTVKNNSSVASGSSVYQGVLSASLPKPAVYTTSASYFGNHPIIGAIGKDGTIIIRNTSPTAVDISGTSSSTTAFTYITQD